MQNDTCFNCHKQGHWARDCPSKSPKKSSTSVRSGLSSSPDHPVIQCSCGNGPCIVLVSKTAKNPDRKFYSCPVLGARRCDFFKWCDEMEHNGPRTVAPKCSCGAGISRRETETSGPNAGRSYFVCHIRKGFGACPFFQWENTRVDTKVNKCKDESKGYGSPQSTCDSHSVFDIVNDNLHNSDDLSLEQPGSPEFGLQKPDNPTDLPNSNIMSTSSQDDVLLSENQESGKTRDILSVNQHDPSPFLFTENESCVLDSANGNLVMQEAEQWDSLVEKTVVVRLMSQSCRRPSYGILCRQMEFWWQISAAVDISKRDIIYQSLGLHMLGWLGRLAFPPSRCLTDRHPAPFFCVIFPSFDPICVPQDRDMLPSEGSSALSHCLSNAYLDKVSPSIPGLDLHLWNGDVWKPSGLNRSFTTMDETGIIKMLKFLEQTAFHVNQLFTILNSINPSDHNSITRGASEVFSVLNGMSTDNNTVNRHLKEFVDSALRFNAIEQAVCNESSMEELIELYNEQTVRFDDISKVHEKVVADFTASTKRLESLNEEASRVRYMLSQIENQLSCCEAETSDIKTRVDVISRDMLESKRSMQEAEQALKLRQQREEERCAAKAALEKAGIRRVASQEVAKDILEESSTSQKAVTQNSKRQHGK